MEIASALHRFYADQFQLKQMNTLLANRAVLDAILAGEDPEHIAESWRADLDRFEQRRQSALLYPNH